ncbi:MAG TPA: hypothetical protein VM490_08755 [Armatimonadaceae bacterium]|nr:hypothetical protein [Armatimonadaceae bacterium]
MSVSHTISRRRALTGGLAALVAAAGIPTLFAARPALAHDADCPYCKLKVVQDTKEQDNEVVLRYGRKRIEYRCVFCALAEAQTAQYKTGDVTVLAPSEKKAQPVVIERKGGKWSAPAGAVFVAVKQSHNHCQTTYRAFTTKAAFDAHVAKNQPLLKGAKPLDLNGLLAVAKGQ